VVTVNRRALYAASVCALLVLAVPLYALLSPSLDNDAAPTATPESSPIDPDRHPLVPYCDEGTYAFCVGGEPAEVLTEAMNIFDVDGPAAALLHIQSYVDSGVGWTDQCHQMLHVVGHEAARAVPMEEVFEIDNRLCQDGFLDGAMEGFADYTTEEEFWRGVEQLCRPLAGWKAQSCAHGMGHAIAFRVAVDHREAANFCDLVPEPIRFSCVGGVVMGITQPVDGSALTKAGAPKYTDQPPEVIDQTCEGLKLEYSSACYTLLWTLYPSAWDADTLLTRLDKVCAVSQSPEHCYDGYGSALYQRRLMPIETRGETGQEVRAAAVPLIDECLVLGENAPWCMQAFSYSAAWWYTTLHSTMQGYVSMCDEVSGESKKRCLDGEDEIRRGYPD
jgi:hypothetical protein